MRFKIFAVAASFAVFLGGCATSVTPVEKAVEAPAISYRMQPKPDSPELAKVVFVRDTGIWGSGLDHRVFINGEKAVVLATGEKATFNLLPDEYVFGVTHADLFGQVGFFSIDQKLKAGMTYYYRLFSDGHTPNTYIQRFFVPEGMGR